MVRGLQDHGDAAMSVLLTVIAGGADTGKSLVAEAMAREKGWPIVARDPIRASFRAPVDEAIITAGMAALVETMLLAGLSVITVSWNHLPSDEQLWLDVAQRCGVPCRWIACRRYYEPDGPGGAA